MRVQVETPPPMPEMPEVAPHCPRIRHPIFRRGSRQNADRKFDGLLTQQPRHAGQGRAQCAMPVRVGKNTRLPRCRQTIPERPYQEFLTPIVANLRHLLASFANSPATARPTSDIICAGHDAHRRLVRQNAVDNPKFLQILRRDFQRRSRCVGVLRRERHQTDAMLPRSTYKLSAPATKFDSRLPVLHMPPELPSPIIHKRHTQLQALIRTARNGFRLAALGTDARITPAGRQRDDRQVGTFAISIMRMALRYPSGCAIPKLCLAALAFEPFSWLNMATDWPCYRPRPAITAWFQNRAGRRPEGNHRPAFQYNP